MKKKNSSYMIFILFIFFIFSTTIFKAYAQESYVVDTLNPDYVTAWNMQAMTVYAQNLYWVFYSNYTGSEDMVYKTSSDGETWSSQTIWRASSSATQTRDFSITYDYVDNKLHYAIIIADDNDNLRYRCGTLNANGSITWLASEGYAYGGASLYHCNIILDSSRYPVISVTRWRHATYSGFVARKSLHKNGTWTEDTDFLNGTDLGHYINASGVGDGNYYGTIYAIQNEKILSLYASTITDNSKLLSRLWNGSCWENQIVVSDYPVSMSWQPPALMGTTNYVPDDEVYVLYMTDDSTPYHINEYRFMVYNDTFPKWHSKEVIIEDTTDDEYKVGHADITYSDGSIFLFYGNMTNSHIYLYHRAVDGWGDMSRVDLLDESVNGLGYCGGMPSAIYTAPYDEITFCYYRNITSAINNIMHFEASSLELLDLFNGNGNGNGGLVVFTDYSLFAFGLAGICMMVFAPCWVAKQFNRGMTEDLIERLGYAMLIFVVGLGMVIAWLWS